jgi:hypothetical protein
MLAERRSNGRGIAGIAVIADIAVIGHIRQPDVSPQAIT